MKVQMDTSGLERLSNKISRFRSAIGPAIDKNTDAYTLRLLDQVKRNASGRPGPNIVTGHYYNSFMIVDRKVVNPSKQTHRLEYGFTGHDVLGRMYHQPAFPHFRPALATVGKEFRGSIPKVIIATWRAS